MTELVPDKSDVSEVPAKRTNENDMTTELRHHGGGSGSGSGNPNDPFCKRNCNPKTDMIALKKLILGNYIHILLFMVPFGFISHYAEWSPTAVFFLNFFAMVPLANVLGDATECLAEHLGEVIGGLLNATFGNAVEIVIVILVLVKAKHFQDNNNNEDRDTLINVVQFSLIGSIFSNSLLVLGCSFLAHGYKEDAKFNVSTTSANVVLLMMASFVMILPAPYNGKNELMVSRAAAIILLIMYGCLLLFVLVTHKDMDEKDGAEKKEVQPIGAFALHEHHEHHEHHGDANSSHDPNKEEAEEEEGLGMSLIGSALLLLCSTILVAILSEFLVGAIEPMSTHAGISEAFVGMILLPIIGNGVEHLAAVRLAYKGKMDVSVSIAIGSATQVAMFVVGLSVIVGWILDVPMTLDFAEFEVQMFIYTSIILFALIIDGKSNWLEGALLICLYVMIAVAVWDQEI